MFWTGSAQSVVWGGGHWSLLILCWVPVLLQPSLESVRCLFRLYLSTSYLIISKYLPGQPPGMFWCFWLHLCGLLPNSFTVSGFWTWAKTLYVLWVALLSSLFSSCKFILAPGDGSHTRYCWLPSCFIYFDDSDSNYLGPVLVSQCSSIWWCPTHGPLLTEGSRKQPGHLLLLPLGTSIPSVFSSWSVGVEHWLKKKKKGGGVTGQEHSALKLIFVIAIWD